MKIDIPEFKGGSQAEEFLGWLFAVEKVLDFKEAPEDKQVALLATHFRGRAVAWRQQIKLTRVRQGKRKNDSWDKMEKHLSMDFHVPKSAKFEAGVEGG